MKSNETIAYIIDAIKAGYTIQRLKSKAFQLKNPKVPLE